MSILGKMNMELRLSISYSRQMNVKSKKYKIKWLKKSVFL